MTAQSCALFQTPNKVRLAKEIEVQLNETQDKQVSLTDPDACSMKTCFSQDDTVEILISEFPLLPRHGTKLLLSQTYICVLQRD